MPGRQVITAEEAKQIGVHPKYFQDCADGVLLTSRGGLVYDRTFLEGFLRPGVGVEHWVSRDNYPALNVVETGAQEMSFYVNRHYGSPPRIWRATRCASTASPRWRRRTAAAKW